MAGTFVSVSQEFGSARLVVVCRLKFCADIGHDNIELPPLICACNEGGVEMEKARFSTVNCAFVDVPPTMPIKNSFVWPAKSETSIEPLLNVTLV